MAETWKRVCIRGETFVDGDREQRIERGKEYITSRDKGDGTVTVFASPFWIGGVPVELFAGEERFT